MTTAGGTAAAEVLGRADYVVIATVVLFSSAVGLYHGVFKRGRADQREAATPDNYFLADRQMTVFPIAFSFFATVISPASIIGFPSESYNFGIIIFWWCLMHIPSAIVMNHIFIPVFHSLKSPNIYKFLELRYNRTAKAIITIVVSFRMVMFGSSILFGTSSAFSRATGVNTWIIIAVVTAICVVYTILGGMKAVMWADVVQGMVIIVTLMTILVIGTIHVGGVAEVWKRNYESGRLDVFNLDVDPNTRHTFWTGTVGFFIWNLGLMATSQANMQRFLTAPSIKDAQRGNMLGMAMVGTGLFLSQIVGLLMYTEYYDCDPLRSKSVLNMNQLVPSFVMRVLGPYPVLPGIFFAGLLSACLSTLSSVFNSMSAVLMDTFVSRSIETNMSADRATTICKFLGFVVGMLNAACVFVTERFPNVQQALVSTSAAIDGPLLVLMIVGILLPRANNKVVIASFLTSVLVSLWIVAGGLVIDTPLQTKPLSARNCGSANTTLTESRKDSSLWAPYFPLYSISYLWISAIGIVVSSCVFVILTPISGKRKLRVDAMGFMELIPASVKNLHRKLPKTWQKILLCDVYDNEANNSQTGTQL